MTRSYAELRRYHTFEERYQYLELRGSVGYATFGFDRYLNQRFYNSYEWRKVRQFVIARDEGCDLGVPGYEIHSRILVHHINPISPNDITSHIDDILNPEYLITTSHDTHNALHFGDASKLRARDFTPRSPGDTRLW